jgi:hypothetical protein
MKRILVTILAALAIAAALPFTARAADDDGAPPSTPPTTQDQAPDKDQAPANDGGGHEKHPAYLHALSDLRAARWMIKHRHGDWKVNEEEDETLRDIEKAIGEIKKAAIDDGKNIEDHPKVDENDDHSGRLHKALDLLRKTRDDLSHAEENGHARGLRKRAFRHIDHAIEHVRSAIRASEHDDDHDGEHRHHHDD